MQSHPTYDKIGSGYNDTRAADPFILNQLYVLMSPTRDSLYLDVGCGTGNYTIELHNKGLNIKGLDPSQRMLDIAKRKAPHIEWILGAAEAMGINPNSFDGAVASLTIHHWNNMNKAFFELSNILKPNASFVLFTSSPHQMRTYWLNHYFPEMMEKSILQMPGIDQITNAAANQGLMLDATIPYYVKTDLKDHFLYVGKERPHLYLDGNIRKGISSFSNLAFEDEVCTGLFQLEADIQSGDINKIQKSYKDSDGDYYFLRFLNKK
ncbi:MAG: class I SAM-dependent methyltransferase [Saprospiraceae bacterium]|nr:class I SAM-dependent methyltransferase [Saprospiraceae bacterium]